MYRLRIFMLFMVAATSLVHMLPLMAAQADKEANISLTPHNLSSSGGGGPDDVKSADTTEICVFCHTPHGASTIVGAPLWNRTVTPDATYTALYESSSLDAKTIYGISASPAGSSKLCLSCHDGTIALGMVNVFAGSQGTTNFNMSTPGNTMPEGEGVDSGFTRNLGIDLTNDHPIGLIYDDQVADADKELYKPYPATGAGSNSDIRLRSSGVKPLVPLENSALDTNPRIQCATCHDPHLYDSAASTSIKFLRLNRFQQQLPIDGSFTEADDMICLACHKKAGWSTSAHATSVDDAADETYVTNTAATLREIPALKPVWQVGCLNCHDTHTVHGARRLLREGTDGPVVGGARQGGNSAIEETCFQCHTDNTQTIISTSTEVPDIETDFTTLARHMPIKSDDQPAGVELHDITDANFSETRALLGLGNLNNRHAECTDCHNPHRVMKNQLFNGSGTGPLATDEGTHEHDEAGSTLHTNIASGVLRGTWGVEPSYTDPAFLSNPTTISYTVKDGYGGLGAAAGGSGSDQDYVTREYQVCLKCHSDYGYTDNGLYPDTFGNRPRPGPSIGTTPAGTNNLNMYTNQAMEFQAPVTFPGEPNSDGNHRSWHPVIDITNRPVDADGGRDMASNNNMFLAPWGGANVGIQTMYCSDCHGSDTAVGTVVPSGNNPWGPHGSNNNFILKGTWSESNSHQASTICYRCHNRAGYATQAHEGDDTNWESGFGGPKDSNLHAFHAKKIGKALRCNWCHVAVPHGWKNKAFLVNLNDVGPEAGEAAAGFEFPSNGNNDVYNQGPYYMNAKLKVRTFAQSGTWNDSDCGSAGSGAAGNDTQTGKDWMGDVCNNPP